jgi:peptide/nickel transport system permease protein
MTWVAKRVGVAIVLIWVVATVVFLAIHLVPGDPAELLLSQGGSAPDPAAVEQLREQLGLDQPLITQYAASLTGALHGDLGESLQDGSPVGPDVLRRLPRTLELIGAAAVLALVAGLPLGLWAAVRRGGLLDRALSFVAALGLALPVFVLGTLMVLLFAQTLHWVSAGGYVPLMQAPGRHFALLAMPALTIAAGLFATVFRMTRASVLDVLSKDFVRTARAKGIAPARILARHVLRNALTPVLTVLGLHMGALLGGTVLVEYVFNWPGLSTPLLNAVDARDYPMVMGIVLTISTLFLLINLAMDLLYAVLDPRIRTG